MDDQEGRSTGEAEASAVPDATLSTPLPPAAFETESAAVADADTP